MLSMGLARLATKPAASAMTSSVSFGADQNFKPGHTYNVMVTRLVGGKEDIYARSQVTLK